jgi:hypothetical protein
MRDLSGVRVTATGERLAVRSGNTYHSAREDGGVGRVSTKSSRLEKWAARARERRPAVVMGIAATGLSYVRSLHRHGIPTLLVKRTGLDRNPEQV